MIYTLTLNPAVDYIIEVDALRPGEVNTVRREAVRFGGKGINVSAVLKELGAPACALGFVAGFTGEALRADLAARGIREELIPLPEGNTRINVKLRGERETELNGQGPVVPAAAVEALMARLEALQAGDILVLSGSVPPSVPGDLYPRILGAMEKKGVRCALDTRSGNLLSSGVRVWLMKPNLRELETMLGTRLKERDEILSGARALQKALADNVLVSLGADGAILLDAEGGVHEQPALPVKAVNTVGAGDSMLAGFLAGIHRGYDYALKLGTAAGAASCTVDGTADKVDILILLDTLLP